MQSVEASKTSGLSLENLKELTKMRLSISVVFSSIAGYFLGMTFFSWQTLFLVSFGGYCLVGASNVFNQIIERDLDALMSRTKNRPIPSKKTSVKTAFNIGIILTLIGLISLYIINPKTAGFGAVSIFLYTSVYTPLKTKTPLSVFAGAFPGAIPFMLGWVAATNSFGIEPGILFMIQFFWQFPHFWAIGWMLDGDYKKAGFKMLPTLKKNRSAVIQIILYTLWTMVIAITPVFGITGRLILSIPSAIIITLLGFGMLYFAIQLYKKLENSSARKLMLASVSYITFVQIIYVVDKYLIQ